MPTNPTDETDDCAPESLSVAAARERIALAIEPVADTEQVPLKAALGRVLAHELLAPCDLPREANSAMDGYALAGADIERAAADGVPLVGRSMAGHPYPRSLQRGECVRIMTGAVLPAGADTVVMQEHAVADGARVRVPAGTRTGQNVRHPGEDFRRGSSLLPGGRRLLPADVGVAASVGLTQLEVRRRIRVAFFNTGDEIREAGAPLGPGEIYDSNRYTLAGMLERLGAEPVDLGIVPDDAAATVQAFRDAAAGADAILTSGGVSVGDADFVRGAFSELGEIRFWRIAMKPGRPLAFGRLGGSWFFGLPGNPVSTMVTFYQFVQPALERLAGAENRPPLRLRLPLAQSVSKRPGREDYQRGRLLHAADGGLSVAPTGPQASHILSSMSQADCFIVLRAEDGDQPAGAEVEVELLAGRV